MEKYIFKLNCFKTAHFIFYKNTSFDKFTPDWENKEQNKWNPVFHLKNGKIEFWYTSLCGLTLNPHTSSFSFKTEKRAEQFATAFIDLFRIVLTN